MTREELIEHLAAGHAVQFLFFWGHTARREGIIDASCLSQWYPRAFEHDGVRYLTAEHFMMAAKARLFRDDQALAAVLTAKTPAEAKKIGRGVRDYDDVAWGRARLGAVVEGNVAKFGQNDDLKKFLLATGERVIVEASPRDRIWGIGMGGSNPDAPHPERWRGKNLLGFALMEARARLRPSA
jgi:ribA/ribD-fused uncharacterized protein